MENQSEFEQAVLDKLLAGDHPVLVSLRAQAERARVICEYTGAGFYWSFEVPSDAPLLTTYPDFKFGDVHAVVDGLKYGAGFVISVSGGRLAILEGYSYEEPWPNEIHNFTLTYEKEPRELVFPEARPEVPPP
jgi:hypothetical protein